MRVWIPLLLCSVLLSGCVTELLAPPSVTARTIICDVLEPPTEVVLRHHLAPALPIAGAVIDDASHAWQEHMSAIADKDVGLFSVEFVTERVPLDDLETWAEDQTFLGGGSVTIHVLWVREGLTDAVEVLQPGILAVNVTAWHEGVQNGLSGNTIARALLFHGLGHALGVVNMGIPLHDRDGPEREQPAGHERAPSSVMSAAWHDAATFPSGNATYRSYSAGIVLDFQAAMADPRVCP